MTTKKAQKVQYGGDGRPVRQGDLMVQLVDVSPAGLKPVAKDARGLVLAEGESSGHTHQIFGRGARLLNFRMNEKMLIVGVGGGELRVVGGGSGGVDRHTPIPLAPGRYRAWVQRSWTSANASRQVQD